MPNLLTHLTIGDQKTTINSIHYIAGTGSTAGTWLGTDSSIDEYYDGLTIAYKIPVKGDSTTTLNITGSAGTALGAKTVYRNGSSKITTHYGVGSVVLLVYMSTGSYPGWHCVDYDSNTTYTNASLGQGYGTCSTAAATAAKAVTLANYALTLGGVIAVKFTYAVPASATLNVNSKGAKAIRYRGAAITANVIKAGDTATFIYDGTYYHLLAIDNAVATATQSTNGLMSSADKTKLDGLSFGVYGWDDGTEDPKIIELLSPEDYNTGNYMGSALSFTIDGGTTTAASFAIQAAKVAKTGSYNDLSDKPTIPSAVTSSTVSSWGFTKNAGTVTSVAMTVPTGLTVTGSPITSSGTLAVSLTSGYSIPTTAKQTNWDAAYSERIGSIGDGLSFAAPSAGAAKKLSLKLKSSTQLGYTSTASSSSQVYSVGLDTNGYLAVAVPWENTTSSHSHGNITNSGTITSDAVTAATGLLVYDSSNKIQRMTAANVRTLIGAGTSSFTGYTSSNKLDSAYIANNAGWTNNTGTVTSVRVQATSPVVSSSNTAQTSTLNTTISLADGYGDTKNPYASKTKNYVLAAPSNAAGAPSFRALVAADIPSLAASKITSGTFDAGRIPSHASSATTYGIGTASNYGHVKIKSGDMLGVNVVSPPAGEVASSGHYHSQYFTTTEAESLDLRKQDKLESGTNIKTINGTSLLGSGNISISAGSSYTLPTASSSTKGGIKVGTGLSMSSDTMSVSYGTTSTTAAAGNDTRFGKVNISKMEYRDTGSPTNDTKYYKFGFIDASTPGDNDIVGTTNAAITYSPGWYGSNQGFVHGDALQVKSLSVSPTGDDSIFWSNNTSTGFGTDVIVTAGKVLKFNKINIPTSSGGSTYGTGSSGKVLKSNGTTVYWGDDNNTTYTFNGAVSTIKDSNLTASRALISNSSGKVAVSAVTSTELGYLDGVTSSIQTQLNGKLTQATADARYALKSEIGGGGTTSVQILTRAEYNALTTISSDVLYIVRG